MERRKFIQNSLALGLGTTALSILSANTLGKHFLENNLTNFSFF